MSEMLPVPCAVPDTKAMQSIVRSAQWVIERAPRVGHGWRRGCCSSVEGAVHWVTGTRGAESRGLPDMEHDPARDRRRERERVMVQEGIDLWKRNKQDQWQQRLKEQRELKDMLSKYSPWGRPGCGAPNPDCIRKRKLRFEGLHADDEHQKGACAVQLGGPGHGAPQRTRSGRVTAIFGADPLLQFQFHEPARRCVDNVLRYRQDRQDQAAYRQQLDAMVCERRRAREEELTRAADRERALLPVASPWGRPGPGGVCWRDPRDIGLNFLHSLGWTDEATLRAMDSRRRNTCEPDVEGGVELVPLLARRRAAAAPRHPLCTTDVTKLKAGTGWSPWQYTRELGQQVFTKQQQMQQARQEDVESCRRHFDTWQHLWGRPGHGAPRDVKVKGNLEAMLRQLPVK